ncbi:ABC transporter transmembrane domain-containing protein, partial [Levilactobacillus brevis]|uniref:ABC transporter transmembrane domain-containing protein n=1 Tax=Levilactobacillus brevis TaxID=1580 RepID=UPI00339C7C97
FQTDPSISFKLFLVSLVIIPVYGIIIASFLRKFDQTNNERMEQEALLGSSLIEDLRGIESIKALGIEKQMYSHIDRRFVKGLKAKYKYSIATVSQGALKDVAQLTITLMILYMGSRMAIRGSISVGQLMAFNALLGYLMNPIEAIIGLQSDLQTAKIANKRLNQVLLMPGEKTEKENTKIIADEGVKKISFKNVGFEYKYGQPVLKDINLEIKKGEKIAVVGLSGSGKTTLAKMLVGFYQVSRGQIEVNDIDIKTINKRLLRNNIAYLPQTPYIFSGSVLDNILLGTVKKKVASRIL